MSLKDVKNRRLAKMRHILNIATEVFAEKGYAGASTNEIADLAGISKRSMYYYMGDKDTLYAAVLQEMISEAYKLLDVSFRADLTPEQRLHRFINAIARVGNNRKLHAIVLRELFSGGEGLPKDVPESLDRMFAIFSSIIEDGKKEGEFKDINPVIASLMLLSFFVYWDLVIPILAKADKWPEDIIAFGAGISDALVDEIHRMFVKLLKDG